MNVPGTEIFTEKYRKRNLIKMKKYQPMKPALNITG